MSENLNPSTLSIFFRSKEKLSTFSSIYDLYLGQTGEFFSHPSLFVPMLGLNSLRGQAPDSEGGGSDLDKIFWG